MQEDVTTSEGNIYQCWEGCLQCNACVEAIQSRSPCAVCPICGSNQIGEVRCISLEKQRDIKMIRVRAKEPAATVSGNDVYSRAPMFARDGILEPGAPSIRVKVGFHIAAGESDSLEGGRNMKMLEEVTELATDATQTVKVGASNAPLSKLVTDMETPERVAMETKKLHVIPSAQELFEISLVSATAAAAKTSEETAGEVAQNNVLCSKKKEEGGAAAFGTVMAPEDTPQPVPGLRARRRAAADRLAAAEELRLEQEKKRSQYVSLCWWFAGAMVALASCVPLLGSTGSTAAVTVLKKNLTGCCELQQLACKQGGIAEVVEVLRRYPLDAGLQADCCHALKNLARNADNQVAIMKAGGIATVIMALQLHPMRVRVQSQGCSVLANLARDVENRVVIAKADGIAAVMAALKQHPMDADLQELGCSTLLNLAMDPNNKVAIVKADGIAVIFAALKLHPTHAGVQEHGCGVLGRLSYHNYEYQVMIVKAGGIKLLVSGLKLHQTHAGVSLKCCLALSYFAKSTLWPPCNTILS